MLRRRALIGVIAAIFGIGVALAVGLSAEAESALAAGQRYLDPFIKQGEALTREGAQRHLFGAGVAVSEDGDTALVSEGGQDAVWVYTRSGSTWTERAKLSAPDNETEDNFGEHLALSADGDTALISDPGHAVKSCRAACCGSVVGPEAQAPKYTESAVLVFVRSGSTWSEVARLTPSEGSETEGFGRSIALSGNGSTALIGFGGGAVWVFVRSGSTWSQEAKLVGSGATNEGVFGTSMALSADGDTALVGNANVGRASGNAAVWVFTRSGSTWSNGEKLAGGGGDFGASIALSGDGHTVLVGEPVERRGEPERVVCHGLFKPFDPVEPFATDVRNTPRAQQAAASNSAVESGQVWVFQEVSAAQAPAQKLPSRFCPGLNAISRNSATDRTGTPWNTYRHVMGVKERYARALLHRCVGLVSVGLHPANGRDAPNHPGHDWEIGATVLARDALPSYREEDLFIDGVRLVVRTVAKRPHLV